MAETLKEKTAKGLFWGAMNNGAMQVIGLVFGIVLGRLLTPSDYGMIAMITIFSLISTALQNASLDSPLQICFLVNLVCQSQYRPVCLPLQEYDGEAASPVGHHRNLVVKYRRGLDGFLGHVVLGIGDTDNHLQHSQYRSFLVLFAMATKPPH